MSCMLDKSFEGSNAHARCLEHYSMCLEAIIELVQLAEERMILSLILSGCPLQ